MSGEQRDKWWKLVDKNIAEYGHHITLVTNEVAPSIAYTIGLASEHGCELVMGGSVYFGSDEIIEVVNEIASQLGPSAAKSKGRTFEVGDLGTFTLGAVREEWRSLMLGAIERSADVKALQIVPDEAHWTLEVARMNELPSAEANRAWKWAHEEWPHATTWEAMTTLAVLRGAPVLEVARWEDDYWEMLPGDPAEIDKADGRLVSLAMLIALDPTLLPSIDLPLEEGLARTTAKGAWQPWRSRNSELH